MTGSPLQNAARVIADHEPTGRGYYSGVVALLGRDDARRPTMDSAIVIRTAEIDGDGRFDIGVGATLVRHSDPAAEAAETRAKAASLMRAMTDPGTALAGHPQVRHALDRRNADISRFWFDGSSALPDDRPRPHPRLRPNVLVVDAEDSFTAMIARQLDTVGAHTVVRRVEDVRPDDLGDPDVVVFGPGPGDPQDRSDARIERLHQLIRHRLGRGLPMICVCLSHQVLSLVLGLPVSRLPESRQGLQRSIDLFGRQHTVGFYNTFSARCARDFFLSAVGAVEVCREVDGSEVDGSEVDSSEVDGSAVDGSEVYALRGAFFASVQFHAESVLTIDGPEILGRLLEDVVTGGSAAAAELVG